MSPLPLPTFQYDDIMSTWDGVVITLKMPTHSMFKISRESYRLRQKMWFAADDVRSWTYWQLMEHLR